ncbi:hypothetical protein [Leptolyngbya sp. AN02str]
MRTYTLLNMYLSILEGGVAGFVEKEWRSPYPQVRLSNKRPKSTH